MWKLRGTRYGNTPYIVGALLTLAALLGGCNSSASSPLPLLQREEALPADAVKMTPETDRFPPVLHLGEWQVPVPMPGPINTVGAEDSPFITPDGANFYFFFTPDVRVPPQKQLTDGVTGIWWAKRTDQGWSEPQRVVLNDDVALDGAPFVQGEALWFASVRAGNYSEVDIYTAKLKDGRWTDVKNAGKQLNAVYDVGELHITTDGQTMYCGRADANGKHDLYTLAKTADGWDAPVGLPAPINTSLGDEDQPFISQDGQELWFTAQSRLGYPGPALFRAQRRPDGSWSAPQEIVSQFAGEPTLDAAGNLYFVHHFFGADMQMIEADIYVAYRK